MWLDYGQRNYDAQLGRFHAIDRFAEKYYHLTPYQYAANNPILMIDINGDSLGLTGLQRHINTYLRVANRGMGGFYTATTNDNGNVIITATGKEGTMTAEESAFYGYFSNIARDTEYDVNHTLVYGKGSTAIDQVITGKYTTGEIDIADLLKFHDGGAIDHSKPVGATQQGKLIHELVEQHEKAKNGGREDYNTDHGPASTAEGKVNGNTRLPQERKPGPLGEETQRFREKNGSITSVRVIYGSKPIIKVEQSIKPRALPRQ